MSVPYEPVIDELAQTDDYPHERPEIFFMQAANRRGQKWPRSIGIVQIIVGILLSLLGAFEVFIIPLTENYSGGTIQFNKSTCYGAGMFAGLVMVLTGSTAVRASMSKRTTTVYRFYNLTMLSLIFYGALVLWLLIAYSKGWTVASAYPVNSKLHMVHMFVTIFTVLGLMFALTSIVYYYDVVCCGELQLWQRWVGCLCSCFGKVNSRPPASYNYDIQ